MYTGRLGYADDCINIPGMPCMKTKYTTIFAHFLLSKSIANQSLMDYYIFLYFDISINYFNSNCQYAYNLISFFGATRINLILPIHKRQFALDCGFQYHQDKNLDYM